MKRLDPHRSLFRWRALAALAVALLCAGAALAQFEMPPAFGRYVNPPAAEFAAAASYRSGERLVGTYYFYWYDSYSGMHLRNREGNDGLTTHPSTLEDFSYKSVRWHRRQLEDMMAAGIDFVLPVYWGTPGDHAPGSKMYWSFEGLPPLVAAREELLREGKTPPRIGMFYDTSTLRINGAGYAADLATEHGRRWFYATIRDFFSLIPARHWAMMDGQPMAFLYSANFAPGHDQRVIDETKRRFATEFSGRKLWIAREQSWKVQSDAVYAWGGALRMHNPGIGSLGPGVDDKAVLRPKRTLVERRDGAQYKESWQSFLRKPSPIVMIETWNEFHEGTDIAESREYGRQYIELTREFVDLFKRRSSAPGQDGKKSPAGYIIPGDAQPGAGWRAAARGTGG